MPLLMSRVVQKFFAKKWTRRSFSLSLCPRFMNRLFRQVLKSNHQDVIRSGLPAARRSVARVGWGVCLPDGEERARHHFIFFECGAAPLDAERTESTKIDVVGFLLGSLAPLIDIGVVGIIVSTNAAA